MRRGNIRLGFDKSLIRISSLTFQYAFLEIWIFGVVKSKA